MSNDVTLFGVPFSDVPRFVGDWQQVVSVDQVTEANGAGRGTRKICVSNGELSFDILPDRALDLGAVRFRGAPMAWISPTGFASRGGFVQETEWLRTFGGGLLSTCGLDTFGPPSEVDGVSYPLHGRFNSIQSNLVTCGVFDDVIVIKAETVQTSVLGERLQLIRTIKSGIGSNEIRVEDAITNLASRPAGLMVMYHCNFGWPLLSPETSIDIPSVKVEARDHNAAAGLTTLDRMGQPADQCEEQVFQHFFGKSVVGEPDPEIRIYNSQLGVGVGLSFSQETLNTALEWKMPEAGHYVLGIEPNNVAWMEGRASAEAANVLPRLEPGRSVEQYVRFTFSSLPSEAENQR